MRTRRLGRSSLEVSELCLGTMMFGSQTDKETAGRMVDLARDAGVNFIDTADVYGNGRSERIVGRHIAPDRERWVLATKIGNAMGDQPNQGGLSRKWMMRGLDESLERLQTGYVDLWYLHRDDRRTPMEEVIATVGDAMAAGKIRYWGFSNYFGWQIGEIVRVADTLGVERPIVAQPLYNALNRVAETDYLPACAHYGIGVVPYSPLARGVLTAKYAPGAPPDPQSRAGRNDERMMETEYRRESLVLAQRVARYAEGRGMKPEHLALLWLLNNRCICSILAGPRTLEQWQAYLASLAHDFAVKDEEFFDALVPSGHPSTPGFSDPRYPITGRHPIVS